MVKPSLGHYTRGQESEYGDKKEAGRHVVSPLEEEPEQLEWPPC